jgi:hypothetical protein
VAEVVQALLDQTVEQLHQVTAEPVPLLAFPDRLLHMLVEVAEVYTLQEELQEPVEPVVVVQVMVLQVPLTQVAVAVAQVLPTILEVQVAQVL